MISKYEISLDSKEYAGKNLAGVIDMNKEELLKRNVNALNVQVCNDTWYGSYGVPDSIGFATPIHLLTGASLICGISLEKCDDVYSRLHEFTQIYNTTAFIKKIKPKIHSSTQTECGICNENYNDHDKILDLSCNHRFHYECITKYVVNKCDVAKCNNFTAHMNHVALGYISTIHATCPFCDTIISF